MSNDALKLELIEWLARVQEPKVLASIQHLKRVSEDDGTIWGQMTAEQKASYESGIAQLDAGLGVDSKDLWKRYGRDPENTDKLKLGILAHLLKTEDPSVLAEVLQLLDQNEEDDWYVQLTDEQRAGIARGMADIEAGRCITSEELRARLKRGEL